MRSNFWLTKWNIYTATFKVILINVPFAFSARLLKTIWRPYLQLESPKLHTAAGVLVTVKILVPTMATSTLIISSTSQWTAGGGGWGTGTRAVLLLLCNCHCCHQPVAKRRGLGSSHPTRTSPEWKWNMQYSNIMIPGWSHTFNG